jgi:hypothetical protein
MLRRHLVVNQYKMLATVTFLAWFRNPSTAKAESEMVATLPKNLNINQVFNLLLQNGATTVEAANLAAISVWEAGNGDPNHINPSALNPNLGTGDYSVGLFQYNFAPGAGNYNAANPNESTRGGVTPNILLGDLNVQAQSALQLLRSSPSHYSNWTTWIRDHANILSLSAQLQNGANVGGTTDTQIPAQTQTDTGETGQEAVQSPATTSATAGSNPAQPGATNLNFTDSIQHSIVQFLLVLVGLVLLIGGIYLLGSKR